MTLDIFTKEIIDIHQSMGIVAIIVGLLGLYISYKFRRSMVFRVKLATVYSLPLLGGLGAVLLPPESFHIIQHILSLSFMALMTILYWREVKYFISSEGFHRRQLSEYLDDIPDLIWVKDIDFRYTFINKSVIRKFGIPAEDVLGKTDLEVSEIFNKKGVEFEFGQNSRNSDLIVAASGAPGMFLEMGKIDGKFLALQVYKGPIYRKDQYPKEHIGYIGVGRDLTYDVEDHKKIEELWLDGKYDDAFKMFCIHKDRYSSMATLMEIQHMLDN